MSLSPLGASSGQPAAVPGAGDALWLDAAALARHLQSGGAALFPTDTLPALAARPAAAGLLWVLKQRPLSKPLILMGADPDQLVTCLGVSWEPAWLDQARRCWPGAVTLVLPIAGPIQAALHPGGGSLGLRVPDCAMARDLLRRSGPLATTSANRSGEPSATTAAEAMHRFPDVPLLGPSPWPAGSGTASTVLAWRPGGSWEVLRAGVSPPSSGPD
jgi:L-threonylcarbamoyladenylate synthase